MFRYINAVFRARKELILGTALAAAFGLLNLLALIMQLFVYRNSGGEVIIPCAVIVLLTSAILVALSVLWRRFFSGLGEISEALECELKEHIGECENVIASKNFFFEDHFIGFDAPVMCRYEEICSIHEWSTQYKRVVSYHVGITLHDGKKYRLFCSSMRSQDKLTAELKKYAPEAVVVYGHN